MTSPDPPATSAAALASPHGASLVGLLTRDAIGDAVRRRIVIVVLIASFLCLMMINSCTSCSGQLEIDGNIAESLDVLGYAGVGVFCVLALWIITLAGVLAADQLVGPFADGSASLILARPVSRSVFALARLLGSLAVSQGAGIVLLGGAGFFLTTRSGLPLGPALLAGAACVLSSLAMAAGAMAASLFLPRVAVYLGVFALVGVISMLNLAAISGAELQGVYLAIDRLGPPLASSLAYALAPWYGRAVPWEVATGVAARLFLWAALGLAALRFGFARRELSRLGSD